MSAGWGNRNILLPRIYLMPDSFGLFKLRHNGRLKGSRSFRSGGRRRLRGQKSARGKRTDVVFLKPVLRGHDIFLRTCIMPDLPWLLP
jgi:hypothetical protein